MQNEILTVAIYFRRDKFAPCIRYIFDLFARVHGYQIQYITNGDPIPPTDILINYTDDNITPAPGTRETTAPATNITITRGTFFGETFSQSDTPPADFLELAATAKATAFASHATRTLAAASIIKDIIAAAFYLLSGYHDWVNHRRDEHGRVLASHMDLPPETWDTPLVNHWFRQFDELLRSIHRGETTKPAPAPLGTQTICLTHDVDLFRKYRPGAALRHIARTAKHDRANLTGEIKRSARVLTGRDRDPYDSFDQLYVVKDRISAPSTFFFLGSGPGGRNGDYNINDHEVRNLLTRARTSGDEIAIHASWDSPADSGLVRAEKSAVESAARTTVTGSRQHYLRFNNPATWNHLADAGIHYDSTGGFPDRCGFKYGWSGCFHPFDLDNMRPLPIIEIPLICMDVTLAAYEKIPAELALERLSNLLDSACDNVPGGAFVFLWHNVMADRTAYPGYWDTFEYFFSVASGSARYITLSQLCDEFSKQTQTNQATIEAAK